jgi:hypothetical protein
MKKYVLTAMLIVPALAAAPSVALAGGGAGFNPGTVISNVYLNPEAGYGYGIGYGFGLPQTAPYYDHCRYAPGGDCYAPRHVHAKTAG